MVIELINKIAVKCSKCGTYKLIDIDLFKLREKKSFNCLCGNRVLRAKLSKGELMLKIDCIACDEPHVYKFKLIDVIKQPLNIISCPITGMEIAFLGKEYDVNNFVKRESDDMAELLKLLGVMDNKKGKMAKLK